MKFSLRPSLVLKALFLVVASGLAFSVGAQTISTVAGMNGYYGYAGDGGLATAAEIGTPNGITSDTSGNIYFSDYANNVVRKMDLTGHISTYAGNGLAGFSGDGSAATLAKLNIPQGLCFDRFGNLYIADAGNFVVRKVSPSGIISTYAGVVGTSGTSGDGGAATLAEIQNVYDVAVDPSGNLYIADGAARIRKVTTSGIISTFAGNGSYDYTGDGSAATLAALNGPTGVAADRNGNIYIADNMNNVIRKVNTSGIIRTVAGNGYGAGTFSGFSGSGGYSGDGGPATDAMLNNPSGISVDRLGNLFIADQWSNVVRKVDLTGTISTLAGNTGAGYSGDGGPATDANLNFANYTATDPGNNVFISDYGNNVIRFVPALPPITIATATDTVCARTAVIFTATISVTGSYHYNWYINGTAVGPDALTFTADSVHNHDSVYCVLVDASTSTVLATSNGIVMTVHPLPDPGSISGTGSVCGTATVTLTESVTGGTWSSSSTAIATVSSSGDVRGVGAGTATISYAVTSPLGCATQYATYPFTVTFPPSTAGTISGASTVCTGTSITLTDGTTGGTWSSSNSAIASVDASGVVNGITTGSVTITYTITNLCGSATATHPVTVNTIPSSGSISGASYVCVGDSTLLSETATGGVWSTSSSALATVSTTGRVRGTGAGSVTITYTTSSSCGSSFATYPMTVIAYPTSGVISGATSVCAGLSTTYTESVSGGTWSSSNTSIATVDASGNVNGVAVGTATISYTVSNACATLFAVKNITVNAAPAHGVISGGATSCIGATTSLTESLSGGTWVSGTTTVATINSSTGAMTGVAAGNTLISYGVVGSCGTTYDTMTVTILPTPSAGTISGSSTVCVGASTTLTSSVTGGSWSSGSIATATVDASGNVYGVATGSVTISYTISNFCGTDIATHVINVNAASTAGTISSGSSSVCVGASMSFTPTVSGGTWSSSDNTLATVDASGNVTGVAAGAVTISYAVTSTCGVDYATSSVTVLPLPNAGTITGPTTVCTGASMTLTDATGSGSWSSSSIATATVDASGNVFGVAAGSVDITYSVTNSCGTANAVQTVSVYLTANAGSISGSATVCEAATTTLSETATGGTWSSSNTSLATVSAGGVVTGVSAGAVTISYTVTTACNTDVATYSMTVNPLPNPGTITGASFVCLSATTTLSDAAGSGSWSSSSSSVATIDAGGIVYPVAVGTTTISYTVTNACGTSSATSSFNVITVPSVAAISGSTFVCAGASTSLTDATTGGTWSTSSAAVATIDGSGNLFGVSAGSGTVSYAVTNTCGTTTVTAALTVGTTPTVGAITGAAFVCMADSVVMTDAISGGVWSSSNTAIATINASTGGTYPVSVGSATITYTITNACGSAATLHALAVYALPSAGYITGPASVCPGDSVSLSETVSTGTWSSSTPGVATVTSTGVVYGVSAGSATISYSVTGICGTTYATFAFTVNPDPYAGHITGPDTVCTGTTIAYTDTVAGGVWSSSNPFVVTVSSTGAATGGASDTANVIYTVTNVCGTVSAAKRIYVNTIPYPGVITGASQVCRRTSSALSCTVAGTNWATSNTNATVSSTGIVNGINPGTVTIYHIVGNGCGADTARFEDTVVTYLSNAMLATTDSVCPGDTIHVSVPYLGGAFSLSNSHIVMDTLGNMIATTSGLDTITYTVLNACGTSSASISVFVRSTADCHTGVVIVNRESGLRVYPNPATGVAHIELNDAANGTANITVTNMVGQVVSQFALNTNTTTDFALNYASGVYYISCLYNGKTTVQRLIVE